MNFLVYIKGWKSRKQSNLLRFDGHILLDNTPLEFEAVLYSFDPQLDKNVSVVFKNSAVLKLKELGISKESKERMLQSIQFRLLRDNGIIYELE